MGRLGGRGVIGLRGPVRIFRVVELVEAFNNGLNICPGHI